MNEIDRIESIKQNGGCHLQNFKKENITYEMCKVAVEIDGDAIYYVPEEYRTEELYFTASKTNGRALRIIPRKFITADICENAAKNYGPILEIIPKEYLNEELCRLAVVNDPTAFKFVPKDILTATFVVEIINAVGTRCIQSLPKEYKNTEFYAQLIELHPEIIWQIPKKYRNVKVCKLAIEKLGFSSIADAVRENAEFLTIVPVSMYTHEAALLYVQGNAFAEEFNHLAIDIKVIEKVLSWEDVALEAVNHIGWRAIEYIAEDVLTEEMCLKAVEVDRQGCALERVPLKYRSELICKTAFNSNPYNIQAIPEEFITEEMCIDAVKHRGSLLQYVPSVIINREICDIALSDEGRGVDYIPDELFDNELALKAINLSRNGMVLSKIPERLRNKDICYLAVNKNALDISNVPEQLRSPTICLAAAKQTAHCSKQFPEESFTHEVCVALASHGVYGLQQVPPKMIDEEVCLAAVRAKYNLGFSLKYNIPKDVLNQNICDEAMRTNPCAFAREIPIEYITKEMVFLIAERCPGCLSYCFSEELMTSEFIEELIEKNPDEKLYIERVIQNAKNKQYSQKETPQ